ncbi:putative glycine--tRNA ligase [Helianthus anomalus]
MRKKLHAKITFLLQQRKKIIVERANYLAKGVDECLVMQSKLLDEVTSYTPVPVLGKFSESFLVLPKDLLVMVMQKHHKHFALTDTNRSLLPYFITVRYIISSIPQLLNLKIYFLTLLISSQVANGAINESIVRKGNEAILRFSEFRGQLNGILFNFFPTLRIDKITCICLVSLSKKMTFTGETWNDGGQNDMGR